MTYNGPALADWIRALPEARGLPDSEQRHLRRWESGVDPAEPVVDAFLCRIGVHLSEVPAWAVLGWPPAAVAGLDLVWQVDGRPCLRRAAA